MFRNLLIIFFTFFLFSCAATYKKDGYTFGNTGNPMDPIKKVHHIDKRKTNLVIMLKSYFKPVGKPKVKMLNATECPWDKTFKISGGISEKKKK